MNIEGVKFELKEKVKSNMLNEIFQQLGRYISPQSPLSNIYINLYSKFSRLRKNELLGVLSNEEKVVEYSKITHSLLCVIDELTEVDLSEKNEDTNIIISEHTNKSFLAIKIEPNFNNDIKFRKSQILISDFYEELNEYNNLILIDVDDFTLINKKYGIGFGNMVLNKILELIKNLAPINSFILFTGKDEFYIALKESQNPEKISKTILKNIQEFYWKRFHQELFITITISWAERGENCLVKDIYRDDRFEQKIEIESVQHWILRTIWGVKNGKINGKNRALASPYRLPENILVNIHDVFVHNS